MIKFTQLWYNEPQSKALPADTIKELSPGAKAFGQHTTWLMVETEFARRKIRVMGSIDEIMSVISGEVKHIEMVGVLDVNSEKVGLLRDQLRRVNKRRSKLQDEILTRGCSDDVWNKYCKLESAIMILSDIIED